MEAVHGDATKRYRYDELGNRIGSWQNGLETTHSYNARNQLIKTQEGGAVKEYRYDARGNLTDITENGQLKANYTFDATNMMVGALTADKGKAEYAYNGFKNRVKKLESLQSIDTTTPDPCKEIRYILDMTLPYDNLLMTQGAQNQSFVWGNSLLSANGEEKFHYLQDHLGSPIRLLGTEQTDTALAYDEFGVPVVGAGHNRNNPFGFTGYQTDDVSGLYFAQNRYYAAGLGRFGAEDPIGSGINWYGYCGGNPIGFIDPLGLRTSSLGVGINGTAFWGASYSIGISYDGYGNIAIQGSTSGTSLKNPHMGLFDVGVASYASSTNADTVFDLEQTTVMAGGSIGTGQYIGLDAIIFSNFGEPVNGFQFQAGWGAGVDMHVIVPQTKTLWAGNINDVINDIKNSASDFTQNLTSLFSEATQDSFPINDCE